VLVVHDEIDLPFGEVRSRLGGGLAGHNGLKSLSASSAARRFTRVRVGVGRPDSTDPEIVSGTCSGAFARTPRQVAELIAHAAEPTQAALAGETAPEARRAAPGTAR
jgi:PTH1 family peptidyl-tRNA hydrolase